MNLGLFGWGLDLMPDFGYPPVQFGGWESPKAVWYKMTAAHNTVVVDGQNQPLNKDPIAGRTTLWADGNYFRAIRASGPELIQGSSLSKRQFERTLCTVDVSNRDFYVVDVFRVVGGLCHDKFVHSHYGTVTPQGLSLTPIPNSPILNYGPNAQMRNFKQDPAPKAGWYVDWSIQDRLGLISKNSDIHLRFTDLTTGAQAFTCEAWICALYHTDEEWIPRIMVRRQSNAGPLASTFVGVIEPYEVKSNIANIRRLPLESTNGEAYPDSNVAIEVQLVDGRRDLLIMADVENPLGLSPSVANNRIIVQKEWGVELEGDLCVVRHDQAGKVERVTACSMKYLRIGNFILKLEDKASLIEQTF
jgi:oligo-alginate lyase